MIYDSAIVARRNGRSRMSRVLGAVVACVALTALAPAVAGAQGEAAWMFDPNVVVELDLGLSPAGIAELEVEPDEYVCGTFQMKVGGVVKGPPLGNVGIRLKGSHGSFQPISKKPGFKVKFDECVDDQTFFGLEKLTLNNMVQDPSMIHEVLSYDLFRAMDVAAPRTGYTFTRLNGEAIGVHANVETYDPISLPAWFPSTQHLYEADVFNVDVVPGGEEAFEVDEGDDEDLSDLIALIAAANDETGDWSEGMAAVADLEQMARMWAVERYVGHWDGYAGGATPAELRPNNYYLHSEDSGVFQMLPWGTDQTWKIHLGFDEPAGGLMFNECYADASCQALYDEALEDLQGLVGGLELLSKGERLAELLAPCQALELESRRKYSPAEIADGVEETLEFVDARSIPLDEYLEKSSPPDAPETSDPPTEEPCSPRPDPPGGEPGPPASPLVTPVPPEPWFGPSKLRGKRVVTRVRLPVAGRAPPAVTARLDGARVTACSDHRSRTAAGRLKLRCRLSERVRDALESRSLKLKVKVGFVPRSGTPEFEIRTLNAPKRH